MDKEDKEHFDTILTTLGTGKWNFMILIGFGCCTFMVPSFVMAGAFLTPAVKYSCKIPEGTSYEKLDECSYTEQIMDANNQAVKVVEKCSNWTFHDQDFPSSVTQSFMLICDDSYLRPTYQTVYMLGNFISAPINGFLSDKYGRTRFFSYGIMMAVSCYFISSFVTNFSFQLILRFLLGFAHPSIVQSGYILCMEISAPKVRSIVGILISLPWALGTIWWGVLGYLLVDWRWLTRASIVPGIIFLLTFYWVFDESPRWLIVTGQHERALVILRKAAKWNKVTLPDDEEIMNTMLQIQKSSLSKVSEIQEEKVEKKQSGKIKNKLKQILSRVLILYQTPELRRITLLSYIMFIVGSTVYYGLSLNAVNFKLDPYVYMMVGGVMEIPAYTAIIPLVMKYGRVYPLVAFYFMCGVTILTLTFIPAEPYWVVITMAMIGKLCISSAYQLIYLIASEIFPTEVRLQALGTSNFVSRIGSIAAPYITDLLGPIYPWIPSVLFGTISLLASIAAYFVPESLNKPLPETILQLEEEAKNRKNQRKLLREVKEEVIQIETK